MSFPSSLKPALAEYKSPAGLKSAAVDDLRILYSKNEFDIPIPTFTALFAEHCVAPFFVFQIFCVSLWCLDEYWYYSLFTLFMLIMFECTVVWQRLKTLKEFRTMSIVPYPIQCLRDSKWVTVQTDELLPGDVVSVGKYLSPSTMESLLISLGCSTRRTGDHNPCGSGPSSRELHRQRSDAFWRIYSSPQGIHRIEQPFGTS